MTNEQIQAAAKAALQGMTGKERVAFMSLFTGGNGDYAAIITKIAALRTFNRNVAMANIALSDPKAMHGLVAAVAAS